MVVCSGGLQWLEEGESYGGKGRGALQGQRSGRVASLDDERSLYAARASGGDAEKELEATFARLQADRARLSKELRQAHAKNTSMRASNMSLKLSNEGLMEELARWRARLGDDASLKAAAQSSSSLRAPPGVPPPQAAADGEGTGAIEPLVRLFESYSAGAQRAALEALQASHRAARDTTDNTLELPAAAESPPASQSPAREGRLAALEQLAASLSDSEAQYLVRQISRRRGGTVTAAGTADDAPVAPPPAASYD